jgi:hypothetical protein
MAGLTYVIGIASGEAEGWRPVRTSPPVAHVEEKADAAIGSRGFIAVLDSLMANVAMTATSRTFACAAAMRTTASKVLVHVGPEPAMKRHWAGQLLGHSNGCSASLPAARMPKMRAAS